MTVTLGLSLAKVTDQREVSSHFAWIILRKVVCSICRDMHQTLYFFERNPQRTGPRSLDAAVKILPLRLKASQPASIALSHSLNANLVHKWIRVQAQKRTALQPPLIPLPRPLAAENSHAASSNICIEIQHPRGTAKVNLPTESAIACATFLRYLLR